MSTVGIAGIEAEHDVAWSMGSRRRAGGPRNAVGIIVVGPRKPVGIIVDGRAPIAPPWGGVSYLSADHTTWAIVRSSRGRPLSWIKTIAIDRDGVKWFVSTAFGWIGSLGADNKTWREWRVISNEGQPVPDEMSAIAIKRDRGKWLGTDRGLIYWCAQ